MGRLAKCRVGDGGRAVPGPESAARARSSGRESIESFVVVFLAFLLWSLEAEGFVIPTGSMAPTLMGGIRKSPAQSAALSTRSTPTASPSPTGSGRGAGPRVARGTCENCRFETAVADAPSFPGDRIYVMKQGVDAPLPRRRGRVQLQRWDVAVFKLPEEPEVRYIKRLVGMPDEVLRIRGGDIWVRPSGVRRPSGARCGRSGTSRPCR